MIIQQMIQNAPLHTKMPTTAHMIQPSFTNLKRPLKPTKIGLLSLLLALYILCKA